MYSKNKDNMLNVNKQKKFIFFKLKVDNTPNITNVFLIFSNYYLVLFHFIQNCLKVAFNLLQSRILINI